MEEHQIHSAKVDDASWGMNGLSCGRNLGLSVAAEIRNYNKYVLFPERLHQDDQFEP